jgi:hypothetical protein
MPLDAAGEVIVGAVEVVGEVWPSLAPMPPPKRWANGGGDGGGTAGSCS